MTQPWELHAKEDIGLVAAVIRQAVEVSGGQGLFRLGATLNLEREAREFLFSDCFDAWVEAAGCDPEIIRAEIMRRCPWVRPPC